MAEPCDGFVQTPDIPRFRPRLGDEVGPADHPERGRARLLRPRRHPPADGGTREQAPRRADLGGRIGPAGRSAARAADGSARAPARASERTLIRGASYDGAITMAKASTRTSGDRAEPPARDDARDQRRDPDPDRQPQGNGRRLGGPRATM